MDLFERYAALKEKVGGNVERPGFVHTINLIVNTSPDQEKIEIAIDASTGGMN